MKITVKSKLYGTQVIDTETFIARFASASSTIFKIIEHVFDEWYEWHTQPGAPMNRDIVGMYNGECEQPAIYSRKGAIRQGIENFIEECIETGRTFVTTKDIQKMDIECAFE